MNAKTLVEISQKNPTAESFFEYAAKRERNVREGISRLPTLRAEMEKSGFHVVPQDLLSTFKELDRAGIGKLEGDKFKWNVSIKAISDVVLSKDKVEPSALPAAKKMIYMVFNKNKEISIEFTPNLTKEEVGFLCNKILAECRS